MGLGKMELNTRFFFKRWILELSFVSSKLHSESENFFYCIRTESIVIEVKSEILPHPTRLLLYRWMLDLNLKLCLQVLSRFYFSLLKKIECGSSVCPESWVCFSQGWGLGNLQTKTFHINLANDKFVCNLNI